MNVLTESITSHTFIIVLAHLSSVMPALCLAPLAKGRGGRSCTCCIHPWVAHIAWKCEEQAISYLNFSNFILSDLDICHVVKFPKLDQERKNNRLEKPKKTYRATQIKKKKRKANLWKPTGALFLAFLHTILSATVGAYRRLSAPVGELRHLSAPVGELRRLSAPVGELSAPRQLWTPFHKIL